MGPVSKCPSGFRDQAVARVLDRNLGVRQVARELRIYHETLRNWVTRSAGIVLPTLRP